MIEQDQHLATLKDIRHMMERSSRFISLSGLSGIAAGICALIGAWFAKTVIDEQNFNNNDLLHARVYYDTPVSLYDWMDNPLFRIAAYTFIAAAILAFIFTYLRSRKTNTPLWGTTAKRVLINVAIPMIVGGMYILKLMDIGAYGYIAPGCLIFYGLAVLNASKYTLIELRYLSYGLLLIGLINLWYTGYGLYFWALGFGVLHIIYGFMMWWKYERKPSGI